MGKPCIRRPTYWSNNLYSTFYCTHSLGPLIHITGLRPVKGIGLDGANHEQRECFTILRCPDWGTRRIGYVETKDWPTFTPYELCLQVDSPHEPVDELYGMPAIKYGNYYIGFPMIYRDFNMGNFSKVEGRTIESQLAYSINGDCRPVMNLEGVRFRTYGILPPTRELL